MVRTQIQLTDEQAARVKRIARRRGVSMAAVIREALDHIDDTADQREAEAWGRFAAAVGAFHGGPGNAAGNHDAVLADAYQDRR